MQKINERRNENQFVFNGHIQHANARPPRDAPSAVAQPRFLRLLEVLVMERPIAPPSVAPKRVRVGLQLGFVALP